MIRVYGISIDRLPETEALIAYLGEEWFAVWKARHPRFSRQEAMRQSLGALALLRFSGRCGILSYEENGRPCLNGTSLGFGLTHTGDKCFCAVSDTSVSVGVDAEALYGPAGKNIQAIAQRWFVGKEKAFFAECPNDLRFLEIWTRKEALAKFLGTGIAGTYREDSVVWEEEQRVRFASFCRQETVLSVCSTAEQELFVAVSFLPGLPEREDEGKNGERT